MHKSHFEIECTHPELVMKAVSVDDSSEVKYSVENGKLIVYIESDSLKSLMKISYSSCNRIQLSIDTIDKLGKTTQ